MSNILTHRDWKWFFTSLTSSEVGNQNISMFTGPNNVGTKDGNAILSFCFLYMTADTSVQIVHNPKLVGGAPLRPTNTKRLLALTDLGPKEIEVELGIHERFLKKKDL